MITLARPTKTIKPRSVKKIRRRFERYKQKFLPDPRWRPPVTVADVQHLLDKIEDLKARLKAEKARASTAGKR